MKLRNGIVAAVVAISALSLSVGSAQAASWPTPGKECKNSGMTVTKNKQTYVCTAQGDTKAWSKAMPVSKSKLTIADQWVKAADSGMSAAFGVITNPTNKPIRIVGASTPGSTFTQLHEVVMKDGAMVMQQRPGGLLVPAKGSLTLKPGADHIMLMGLTKPVAAGDPVKFTLTTSDGSQLTFTAMGRVFAGANETYDAGSGMSHGSGMGMDSGMNMGSGMSMG